MSILNMISFIQLFFFLPLVPAFSLSSSTADRVLHIVAQAPKGKAAAAPAAAAAAKEESSSDDSNDSDDSVSSASSGL